MGGRRRSAYQPPNRCATPILSRRGGASPHAGVRSLAVDLSSVETLECCDALAALPSVDGIFHLAGVLDDGLIVNMTPQRLRTAVQPKAGILSLLELCQAQRWRPRWLVAASSTSSLLGYAGQSNYCAANALLDNAATFGLGHARAGGEEADGGGGGGGSGTASAQFATQQSSGSDGWSTRRPPTLPSGARRRRRICRAAPACTAH